MGQQMRVGFVGAGRMGRPMVDRLVAAGHEVQVLARSQTARAALAAAGAHPVDQVTEAAAGAAVVCVCVFTDAQVIEVVLGGRSPRASGAVAHRPTLPGVVAHHHETPPRGGLLAAMGEGATLVVHTTGSPRTAQAIAAHAAGRGVRVVDAPVSGGPHDVAAGRVTLLAGGAEADVDRVRPVLTAYGDPVLHVGPLGAGQGVKLVNNALFAANIGLLAQAVRLGAQLGVEESVLLGALPHGSANSRALAAAAGRGSVTAFAESVREFLGKDVAAVRAVAADHGASLGVLDLAISELPGI
jgi:3-hydroxyisobutyrate dehydrogenase-like beta-hydroxyacid dehydrogenase